MSEEEWVSMRSLCERAQVRRSLIYRWIKAGLIPAPKRGIRKGNRGAPPLVFPAEVVDYVIFCKAQIERFCPLEALPRFKIAPKNSS